MGRSRYRFGEPKRPHFLTCTIVGWLPVFTRPESVQIVLDSWKFLHEHERMSIMGYVILENHLHVIAVSNDLSKEMGDFKSYTARKIIDLLKESKADTILKHLRHEKAAHKTDREYQLWQEGSHPQEIQNEAMLRQKLEYIHYNPVKRGYVDFPEHWRYSSARNYRGEPGLVPVVTDWA
jgi:REP element-mobilizing transposase RayT